MSKGRPKREEAREPTTTSKPLPDYGIQHQSHNPSRVIEHDDSYELPKDINNGVAIPKTFFNNEGDLDLSKTTGPNAVRYLNAIGLNIPTMFR